MTPDDKRRVLLTGASRGLGRAMAGELIDRGHTLCGCARSPKAIDELRRRWPAPHAWHVVDVADDVAVARWAAEVGAADDPFDLILNNAAIVNANAPLWRVPAEEFDRLVAVNIVGVVNVIRHFLPSMVRRNRGVVVNFSSGWGRSTSPEVAPYCASKWAIEGLTKALADELPEGMAAVPLNPGVINTDMLRSCFGADAEAYPTPQQWAGRAVALLLQLGPGNNGQSLSVGR